MAKSACASSVVSSKWSTAHRLSSCLLYLDPKHVCAATRQSVQAEKLQQSSAPQAVSTRSCGGPSSLPSTQWLAALSNACDLRAL